MTQQHKTIAPAYSPPVENPCRTLAKSNNIGAHTPISLYVGKTPINSVEKAINMIVVVNTILRPYLSPMIPKTIPPIGRNKML